MSEVSEMQRNNEDRCLVAASAARPTFNVAIRPLSYETARAEPDCLLDPPLVIVFVFVVFSGERIWLWLSCLCGSRHTLPARQGLRFA